MSLLLKTIFNQISSATGRRNSLQMLLLLLITRGNIASFLGLVPSEDSSDTRVNRYSITKAGNSHLRRLLVEVAQSFTRGNVGHKSVALKQRQQGNLSEIIAYADKANERLRRRFYKMTLNKGVNRNVATTAIAIARELACFIWGMMTEHVS
jgi:ISCps8, transposase